MSNRNRSAGHNFEREIVKLAQKTFPNSKFVTSRAESRNLDNIGVDVFDVNSNPRNLPLAVLHKKVEKQKKNFTTVGQYAILELDLFFDIVGRLGECPCNFQCKITQNSPNYHKIIEFYNNNKC